MSEPTVPPASQPDAPQGILLSIWSFIWNSIVRVLWLCGYATATALGVLLIFNFNDQGRDLLRLSAESGVSLANLFFLGSALLLGLALWYSSRLLLLRCLAGEPIGWERSRFGRTWLPRVYGTLVPLSIGVGFLHLDTGAWIGAWVLGVLFVLLAAGLWWFFYKRREWFVAPAERARGLTEPGEPRDQRLSLAILSLAQGAVFVLLISFVAWPVSIPQTLGTPAIVLLGFTGIALFGGLVLTYAFLVNGLPAGTALALILAAIFGFFNDNHWIRLTDEVPAVPRLTARPHYDAWRQANPAPVKIKDRDPVILVAAAGGGIRAAYWTASTLATLEEKVPTFGQSLFTISAVSGGSVGAAVYTAIKRLELETGTPPAGGDTTLETAKRALGQDFLSPVVAGLLFPDLIQRFIPYPFPQADRQRFLELGFEHALAGADNPLPRSFVSLYADGFAYRLPGLMLNAAVVDSGARAITSNIDLDGFTDTLDTLAPGFQTQAIRLSAAAGASARFTYVSPAGSLTGPGALGTQQKIRLVDGGYFENSGATTIIDLLDQIADPAIFPILILIRNDPEAPSVCAGRAEVQGPGTGPAGPPASDFLSEVASPVRALLNARTARGRLAEVSTAKRVEGPLQGAVIEISLAAVVQAELQLAQGRGDTAAVERIRRALVEPPLGWSLSQAARAAMDRTMATGGGGLKDEFANLTAVLSGDLTRYRPCNAR